MLITLFLQFATISVVYSAPVYKAELSPLASSGVSGLAFVSTLNDAVAYAGYASAVSASISSSNCTQPNACGAHIHSGTSCSNPDTQGGHYYAGLSADPWTVEQYTSDEDGIASFGAILDIGTTDVDGRAFVLHDESGARVACGILTLVEESDLLVAVSEDESDENVLVQLSSSGVSGSAVVYNDESSGYVCFAGTGTGLEPNLDASGADCTSTNGCGAHIHSGSSCVDKDSQGGHFYDADMVDPDPWLTAGYRTTSNDGIGHFVGCLKTGQNNFESKAFVLHNNGGSRVACGLLRRTSDSNEDCGPFGVFLHWIIFLLTFGTVRLPCL